MKPILFSLFGNTELAESIRRKGEFESGVIVFRHFPDEETFVKINTDVKNRKIIFMIDLARPDSKIIPLIFAAQTARDLGAIEIGLVAPYLVYMRQDAQFHAGEGVTSKYFATLLSEYFNWLVTLDPHLHRFHSLSQIYKIPSIVLHPTDLISQWIKQNVESPVLIGPDKESEQWVSRIADQSEAPYIILEKIRKGDRSIEVHLLDIEKYKNNTPVLLDDIISSGRTMIEPLKQLQSREIKPPICVAVHAVFADNSYQDLLNAGARKVVTCNTIPHISNAIDVSGLIIEALKNLLTQEKKNEK